ncbi:MAG: hypothetical protein J5680_02935 [Neisseriaceae bacterium]|nr:hypothetical protein [Neisseriaceae bacterium]
MNFVSGCLKSICALWWAGMPTLRCFFYFFRLPEKVLKRVGNKLPTLQVFCRYGGSKTHPTAFLLFFQAA